MLLSILIDAEVYYLGFSVAMDENKRSLPLLYVTRPIIWRRKHDYPLAIERTGIMLLSVLHLLNLKRRVVHEVTTMTKRVADTLYSIPYELSYPTQVVDPSLTELVAQLAKKYEELERRMVEKYEELERRMIEKYEELERRVIKKGEELERTLAMTRELEERIEKLTDLVTPERKHRKT